MAKKIRSATIYKLDLPPGKSQSELNEEKFYRHSFTEMRVSGDVILDIKYLANGTEDEKQVNTFDESGRLIEKILFMQDNEIAEHKTYEYDEGGKISKVRNHYADGTCDTIQYKYGSDALPVEKTTFDSDNEVEAQEFFLYDDGKLIETKALEFDQQVSREIIAYDESGRIAGSTKWQQNEESERHQNIWDEKNRLVKVLTYNPDEKLIARLLYSYDDLNRIVGSEYETEKGRVITTVNYDEKGNAIRQIETNATGELNHTVARKFNENNDVIEARVFINRHGRDVNEEYLLKYEYEYFED
jgi:antitoxin component YwqK of YwqJK toxin-antitoxin module